MTDTRDALVDLIYPVVESEGFELVRVRITGAKTKTLQVMAERSDHTMTAEDCARLSRALSPVLEAADPIAGAYVLEVSSPGIDRPLVRPKDFEDWAGWPAKLELNRLAEGRKRFSGVVAGMDGGAVAFDIDGEEETALFPLEWIASARLVLTDALIEESLKAGRGARAASEADPQDADKQDADQTDSARHDNDAQQETLHGDHQ